MESDRRILVFSGGRLGSWALDEIREGDTIVGADRGALFLIQNGVQPDLSLGDFDSVTPEEQQEVRRHSRAYQDCDPVMKDFTDTEMAFAWALEQNPLEIVLLGVTGTRLDHTLANVQLLVKGLRLGIPCKIIDANNEIIVIERRTIVLGGTHTHVSLLPLTPEVTGITLHGFRYPLERAVLSMGQSLGVSNVLDGDKGRIEIEEGLLLVIKSRD
jgi:thiamine pyrophosphokinase